MSDTLTFFHAPQSRSSGVAVLLAELDAPHVVRLVNMKAGEQRQPGFLAVNPMGKVPAILHGRSLITEQVAIYIYLADLFQTAGLAPALNDADRGPYLRWLAFYGSCFEPALVDKAMKRDPAPPAMSPYGSLDVMQDTLTAQLRSGPYMLGDRFTAADVLWGTSLGWMMRFGLLPDLPEITTFVDRIQARPTFQHVRKQDETLAAKHGETVKA